MQNGQAWYQLSVEQVLDALETSTDGLTTSQAKERLSKYGHNELEVKATSALVRFIRQFHNALYYVLFAAAIVTFFLDKYLDMYVILGVILASAIIGYLQEGKAESALEDLKKMVTPYSTVIRDGEKLTIPVRDLVPGDVVLLEAGDRVPADLRLSSAKDLYTDEAVLTGESTPVQKDTQCLDEPDLPPGDQQCMCFSGTFVTRGSGQGVVTATGQAAEIGKIAGMLKERRQVIPPIVKKVNRFVKWIIIAILSFGAITFGVGVALGYDFEFMFLATVAMIVAVIPEGLPAALISAFAIGAVAMGRRNALVRRLPAVETLGSTTVICSDKTGTLTRNEMTVVRILAGAKEYRITGTGYEPRGEFLLNDEAVSSVLDDKDLFELLRAGYLCNNADLVEEEGHYRINGDPTEGALVVSAAKAGLKESLPRLDEIPFDSERQYMATLHQGQGDNIIYVKGAPEKVLEMCHDQLVDRQSRPLKKEEISAKVDEMSREALRSLAMAFKTVSEGKDGFGEDDLQELTFLGIQGMIDPPREEAIEAIRKCDAAGIRAVMITGDYALTAKAVARQMRIGVNEDRVLTGEELARMSDKELHDVVDEVSVYARVAPDHKFRIVQQLQKRGHIVATTGDGVNDAPALKSADIGVAMGITGTEVSKNASDMVLSDDNFASIVAAVEEGRHIFNNIWKIILFLLPTNGGQGLILIAAMALSPFILVFRERLPLEPVQALWVNLFIAVACAIPLVWEPKEEGLLDVPPRDPNWSFINRFFLWRVGLVSIVSAGGAFLIFLLYHNAMKDVATGDVLTQAQTAAFTTIILIQVCYLFTARSVEGSAFTFSPFSNRMVLLGGGVTVGVQLLLVYSLPLLGIAPLRTEPFAPQWWVPIALVGTMGFFAIEGAKLVRRLLRRSASQT
ncbi:MAG: HAD-IC family P-type ATPase [Dehalococcoidia bacterium]